MVLDAEEKYQVDQIKAWFKQYGLTLLVSIVVVIAAFVGWQRWQQMNERAIVHASKRYEQLLDSMAANDTVASQKNADYLINRYPHSTYAKLATLLLAHAAIEASDYPLAQQKLKWVMDTASVPSLRAIARLRYARLWIQMNQPETALTVLTTIDSDEYRAPAEEIKGDAYNAMGNIEAAKQAYQQALHALPDSALNRPLLQMKYNNMANDR